MGLIVYVDILSPNCRAIMLFLEANSIPYDRRDIVLLRGEHKTETFLKINPAHQVPCIDHDGFVLTESVAILKYLATVFNVPDHWYPSDVKQRARVDEALGWHNSTFLSPRKCGTGIMLNKFCIPFRGNVSINETKLEEDIKGLETVSTLMETIFLKETPFMNGNDVTIADLLTICEFIEPTLVGCDVFPNHSKLREYRERIREKINPYWDELQKSLLATFKLYEMEKATLKSK